VPRRHSPYRITVSLLTADRHA